MLADNFFTGGEINAEQFVIGNIALNPLDMWAKLAQDLIRFDSSLFQLPLVKASGLRNIPLDDKSTKRHVLSPIAQDVLLNGTMPTSGVPKRASTKLI